MLGNRKLYTVIVLHALTVDAAHSPVIRHESGRLSQTILAGGQIQQDRGTQYRIPDQLIITGKQASLSDLSGPISKNMQKTLQLNRDLHVRWFSDDSCRNYLAEHYDQELIRIYGAETRGSYRGDICRTAILLKEGGFYTDLDVEWKVPMRELVDSTTSFMSVKTADRDFLNAVMAVEPESVVMNATLGALREWYRPETNWTKAKYIRKKWMGPATLRRGLEEVARKACPKLKPVKTVNITCGSYSFRLYEQRRLKCKPPYTEDCPHARAGKHTFDGLKWGLFEPGKTGRLVGWPRYAKCHHWGCDSGGWDVAAAKRGIKVVTSHLSKLIGLSSGT